VRSFRLETVIPDSGEIQLIALPFRPGEPVEVIVLGLERPQLETTLFPLAGTVLKYDDPTEPVAEADWAGFWQVMAEIEQVEPIDPRPSHVILAETRR
jgi:hypothetical protein